MLPKPTALKSGYCSEESCYQHGSLCILRLICSYYTILKSPASHVNHARYDTFLYTHPLIKLQYNSTNSESNRQNPECPGPASHTSPLCSPNLLRPQSRLPLIVIYMFHVYDWLMLLFKISDNRFNLAQLNCEIRFLPFTTSSASSPELFPHFLLPDTPQSGGLDPPAMADPVETGQIPSPLYTWRVPL